jgi:uncharacterized protein YecE (DUF72 family)
MPDFKLNVAVAQIDCALGETEPNLSKMRHFTRLAAGLGAAIVIFPECSVTGYFIGDKLGALLFQLPPNLKKDLALFDAFLDAFPPRVCAAFEFRHTSWLDDEVYARLRARNLALCLADSEKLSTPIEITADYAYFRLRDEGYQEADIAKWADVIREKTSACEEVFVYFKHEESGKGPEFARLLMDRLGL